MSATPIDQSKSAAPPDDVWRQFIAASKKKKGPLYTRYVNRNAAIPLTYVFWRIGVHPNAVTAISFATTHAALLILVFAPTTMPVVAGAWLLLALGFALDSSDGQLARVSSKTSRLGEWLDHSLDMAKILNFNMALAYVMIASHIAKGEPLLLPFLAAFLNLLAQPAHFFVINMKDKLLRKDASGEVRQFGEQGGIAAWIMRFILNGADYGLFILIVLLLPRQEWFVPVYLAYGVFFMLIFTSHFARTTMMIARQPKGETR